MYDTYYEVLRDLVFRSIQKETRLSAHQTAQLQWKQIHGNVIITRYKREVEMSRELVRALSVLPHSDPRGFVFIGGTSLFTPQNHPKMRELMEQFEAEERAKRPKKTHFISLNWGAVGLTKAE